MTTTEAFEASKPEKMKPGDDLHLCLLAVPMNWHMLTGKDYQDMLAFGRAVWNAATEHAAKCCESRADAYRSTNAPGWHDVVHECTQCAAAIRGAP